MVVLPPRTMPVSISVIRASAPVCMNIKIRMPMATENAAAPRVTHGEMVEMARRLVDTQPLLHSAISPWASDLLSDIPRLPLHPVAQLLLTAARGSSPQAYEHALQAMLIAGALARQRAGQGLDLVFLDPPFGENGNEALFAQALQAAVPLLSPPGFGGRNGFDAHDGIIRLWPASATGASAA